MINGRIDDDASLPPEDLALLDAYRRGLTRDLADIAAEKPNVTLDEIDTGHMVHFEAPVELARRICAFDDKFGGGL